jgi:hypothetical protein
MNIDFLENEEHREWLCVHGLGCIEFKFVEIFGVSEYMFPSKIEEEKAMNDLEKNLREFIERAEEADWRVFVHSTATYRPVTRPEIVARAICEVCRI